MCVSFYDPDKYYIISAVMYVHLSFYEVWDILTDKNAHLGVDVDDTMDLKVQRAMAAAKVKSKATLVFSKRLPKNLDTN